MAWTVDWRVTIDGSDVSSFMRPLLTAIEIVDRDGTASDAARLTFDDTGGQCLLPRTGAKVGIFLNGVSCFDGVVDSTPWTLTRGGGRLLQVNAKGFDTRGKAKEGQRWHLDDATLGHALDKAARLAGLSGMIVDPAFASIMRDYWSPDGVSFLAWGEKLARQFGATFKIRGDRAVFARRGQGLSAIGQAMPTVRGTVPGNVISINIDPTRGRARYGKARARYFDRETAQFVVTEIDIDGADLDAIDDIRGSAADETQARSFAEAHKVNAERDAGSGSVEIDLAPEAQAEGTFVLSGARPGIDGSYRITGVTHKANRGGGATTVLELKQPGNGAGKDDR
ncbi:phage late control D family protein [Pararhizobium haloflavum]|uniref:phage late control D family protein n=1 Tax=Pararhizobium haloflavum TaxID=2037914 RepID=UPI000C19837D|nr:late control D family protein [Pararhizobium haloflavum]